MYTIKQARLLRGMTQIEVAAKMGVSRDVYRKIEFNPDKATIEQAKKLLNVINFGFDDIFFGTEST